MCNTINAQTDPDFLQFKKQADDCFTKKDYPCAEKWYKAALVIKENDEYCKEKLSEIKNKPIKPIKSSPKVLLFDYTDSFSEGLASVKKMESMVSLTNQEM